MDEKDLLPGTLWKNEIPKTIRLSKAVIVCLSRNSVNKAGYVHKEIKIALDVADEQPDETIFIIPVRLDECVVPDRLMQYHWVDLFEPEGYEQLLKTLARVQFRDIIFQNWVWMDLSGYDSRTEMPMGGASGLERIGKDNSLFSFVRNHAPQVVGLGARSRKWWLLCDSSPGQIADFVGLDPEGQYVNYIYVKGHKDGNRGRIAVTSFFDVVGQAVKNSDTLQHRFLINELLRRSNSRNDGLVWRFDGRKVQRLMFIEELKKMGPHVQRRVVIFHPGVDYTAWSSAVSDYIRGSDRIQGFGRPDVGRMRQLSALLFGTQSTLQTLGATLIVIAAR
jgi:hypothetical protein